MITNDREKELKDQLVSNQAVIDGAIDKHQQILTEHCESSQRFWGRIKDVRNILTNAQNLKTENQKQLNAIVQAKQNDLVAEPYRFKLWPLLVELSKRGLIPDRGEADEGLQAFAKRLVARGILIDPSGEAVNPEETNFNYQGLFITQEKALQVLQAQLPEIASYIGWGQRRLSPGK